MSRSLGTKSGSRDSLNWLTRCVQPVRPPDPLHRVDADADRLGHHRGRPMRGLLRRVARASRPPVGSCTLVGSAGMRECRVFVAQQTRDPRPHEPFLSAPHRHLSRARPAHHLAAPPSDIVDGRDGDICVGGHTRRNLTAESFTSATSLRRHHPQLLTIALPANSSALSPRLPSWPWQIMSKDARAKCRVIRLPGAPHGRDPAGTIGSAPAVRALTTATMAPGAASLSAVPCFLISNAPIKLRLPFA